MHLYNLHSAVKLLLKLKESPTKMQLCLVKNLIVICLLIPVSQAHLSSLLNICIHNDVMVKCVPPCPRLCVDYNYKRKCRPRPCQKGCVCREGWVRKGSEQGRCIKRTDCLRWIL